MKKKIICILFILLISLSSCRKDNKSQTTEKPEDSVSENQQPGKPPVYLTGLSSTSNEPEKTPDNLLDGDPGTMWITRKGAGPDEGVMAVFAEPVYISEVQISQGSGDFCKINKLDIYADGQIVNRAKPDLKVRIKSKVKSIYLRIAETDDMHAAASEEDGTAYMKREGTKSCALSGIVFYDKSGEALNIIPPKSVKGSVNATSTLTPPEAYGTDFLFDSSRMFGWAEGADGDGTGEKLTFKFDSRQTITGFIIWNGYQRSLNHYQANARIKRMTVNCGANGQSFELGDRENPLIPQKVSFSSPAETDSITITVDEVYPGHSYEDLVISEILFTAPEGYIRIETGGIDARSTSLISKVKNTVLENVVDRSISNFDEFGDVSLCLRSNNSFVIYMKVSDGDSTASFIYDGNWQIVSTDENSAKIRIFGKKLLSVSSENPYSDTDETETITIFSDNLTVNRDTVSAEKTFGTLVHNF